MCNVIIHVFLSSLKGCSFGYFVGGWGKPPVDEIGRPLYGDVFGLQQEVSFEGKDTYRAT